MASRSALNALHSGASPAMTNSTAGSGREGVSWATPAMRIFGERPISPASGSSSPWIAANRLLLPQPFLPITPTRHPACRLRSIPESSNCGPRRRAKLEKLSIRSQIVRHKKGRGSCLPRPVRSQLYAACWLVVVSRNDLPFAMTHGAGLGVFRRVQLEVSLGCGRVVATVTGCRGRRHPTGQTRIVRRSLGGPWEAVNHAPERFLDDRQLVGVGQMAGFAVRQRRRIADVAEVVRALATAALDRAADEGEGHGADRLATHRLAGVQAMQKVLQVLRLLAVDRHAGAVHTFRNDSREDVAAGHFRVMACDTPVRSIDAGTAMEDQRLVAGQAVVLGDDGTPRFTGEPDDGRRVDTRLLALRTTFDTEGHQSRIRREGERRGRVDAGNGRKV